LTKSLFFIRTGTNISRKTPQNVDGSSTTSRSSQSSTLSNVERRFSTKQDDVERRFSTKHSNAERRLSGQHSNADRRLSAKRSNIENRLSTKRSTVDRHLANVEKPLSPTIMYAQLAFPNRKGSKIKRPPVPSNLDPTFFQSTERIDL
jgi:hypothetical protein